MNCIEIQGYKSIKDLRLELRPINLLIGANGSGKSNLLSFFVFLKTVYTQDLKRTVALSGGIDKFLHNGQKITSEISTKLTFHSNAYSFCITAGENGFIFTNEGLWYDNNPFRSNPVDISNLSSESQLKFSTEARARYVRNYLQNLKKYHFHDTSVNSPFTKVSNIENDSFVLYSQGENLAAFLYGIQKKHSLNYNLIVRTIQSVAPYFNDFYLKPDENGNITLKWSSKYSESIYGVNDLSDGTKRFIALATLFLQPELPSTIIIDEPELGLHPFAIAKLSGLIHSVSGRGCQVLMATQSTDLISHFGPEDIITVDQVNGESIYRRLSSDTLSQWLEEYTLDELWKRNIIIGGQPNSSGL